MIEKDNYRKKTEKEKAPATPSIFIVKFIGCISLRLSSKTHCLIKSVGIILKCSLKYG